jgi:hypothetical protein
MGFSLQSARGALVRGITVKTDPLDRVASPRRSITFGPALQEQNIEWWGWPAFRRGLATNLHGLGVSDKRIQTVLRHANVSTTLNNYIKSVPSDAVVAMNSLEAVCAKYALLLNDRQDE